MTHRLLAAVLVLAVVGVPLAGIPVAAAPGDDVVVPAGAYSWPLPGVDGSGPGRAGAAGTVARRFLPPPTPYGRGHRGADLVAAAGSPVLAAGDGVVVHAGPLAGRGVVSVLHAGGLRTTYEPVRASVAPGARVARGTPLGVVEPGHRGCAAACLHWGLRRAVGGPGDPEQYLDPLLLVGLGRPRLLPQEGAVSGR